MLESHNESKPTVERDPTSNGSTPHRTSDVRLLIAGSVRLYREGLAYSLGKHSGLSVVVASDYELLVERVVESAPDILLLDVSAPSALEVIHGVQCAAPRTKVVAFAIEDSDETVLEYAEAGVVAFVPRDCSIAHLIATLESVARDEAPWSPRRTALLCRRLAELASAARTPRSRVELTTREREIVDFIDTGMSNKQIAAALGIEVATVKNHVHNLLEKLQVGRRGEAAAFMRNSTARLLRDARRPDVQPPGLSR